MNQSVAGEETGLNEAHVDFREAEFLHDDRRRDGKIDAVHVSDEAD